MKPSQLTKWINSLPKPLEQTNGKLENNPFSVRKEKKRQHKNK
jgi:hypothetical protein